MSKFTKYGPVLFLTLTFLLSACSGERKLYRTGPILVKNKVVIINPDSTSVKSSDLSGYVSPSPNTKFLGVTRLKLFAYEISGLHNKKTKLNTWLHKIGEPPVYVDTFALIKSQNQIQQQLFNIGYFSPKISILTDTTQKSKLKVSYLVNTGKPHLYNKIDFSIAENSIYKDAFKDISNMLIAEGNIYNSYVLDKERERVTNIMVNQGYFLFSKDLIHFYADTVGNSNLINISYDIVDPTITINNETNIIPQHKFYINDVNIYPNYDVSVNYDKSLNVHYSSFPSTNENATGKYNVYCIGKEKLKASEIIRAVQIKPGDVYSSENVTNTNKGLSAFNVIRYANISFTPVTDFADSLLNCNIELTRRPIHVPSIETEVTNSSGKLGMGLNIAYSNRNIFRRGETFTLKGTGSVEMQVSSSQSSEFIQTVQYGASASLFFPRFIGFSTFKNFPRYLYPKTTIELGYNYQKRTIYKRHIANASFRYDWRQNTELSHILTPLDFNLIKIDNSPEFQEMLDNMTNTLYKSQYTDHILFGTKYSFVYNNQNINKLGNFFYLRTSIESSGNLLNLLSVTFDSQKDEGKNYYELFNVRYAQYVLGDVDFKYFHYFANNKVFVARLSGGVGVPYSNSEALPMEKSFFGGGANDVRGWLLKTLGPGSYNSDLNIERLGDISFKCNVEFRFPIYKFVRGAVFADAGNVWLMKEDSDFPGGNFELNRFYKEIAVSAGFGLRLDFKFFVVRLDTALPVSDPALEEGSRIVQNYQFSDFVWNFAIGYPF
ncbi:MAG: BamA/TamA family outer membrane protein [Bacteroidales bacterium]|jgi:outer membrane protein assembly factor BamA|nr:BamA/TamA family outer membrane protein [Bacteroidales bacterium]MDD2204968.1 BamA/TamA family outer membrane protein [Bacteroidales bacterium]MDD3151816.1 BamA/TamA family outer membrane protein [Bacteroidales bacterium]MDD3913910.1 BamA/TamA family outer membrane protein [Bacteroidales bacterium]MDD4634251.1 BamA/TamA family outer membrane protein [Bacteroidales bacterium]